MISLDTKLAGGFSNRRNLSMGSGKFPRHPTQTLLNRRKLLRSPIHRFEHASERGLPINRCLRAHRKRTRRRHTKRGHRSAGLGPLLTLELHGLSHPTKTGLRDLPSLVTGLHQLIQARLGLVHLCTEIRHIRLESNLH